MPASQEFENAFFPEYFILYIEIKVSKEVRKNLATLIAIGVFKSFGGALSGDSQLGGLRKTYVVNDESVGRCANLK